MLRWGGQRVRWLLAGLLALGVAVAVTVGVHLSRDEPDPQYRIETKSCYGDRTDC